MTAAVVALSLAWIVLTRGEVPARETSSARPAIGTPPPPASKVAHRRTEPGQLHPPTKSPRRAAARKASDCGAELTQRRREWLARRPEAASPEAGITEALMQGFDDGDGREHLAFARLLHRWPLDVGVAWMAWHRCLPTQPCDRRVSAEHLVELDGANGAAWLALMDSLSPLNDTGGIDIALARAAQAPTFDLRRGSIYVHLYPALAEMLPSEECWEQLSPRLRESVGGEMTRESVADLGAQLYENLYMPPGFSLEFNCQDRKGRRLTPSRRRDCVAVLERFANQPSIPDREKGLRMLIRLLGQDGSAQWREEYRRVLWLRQQAQYVLYEPGSAAQIWAGGEINYYLAILQERGSWPPPPDWLPEREFARNLILEGR